jgi:uncharacterized protein YlxW (UPF0749 family)
MIIEELNQKVESLQHEVSSLQNALVDSNKSKEAQLAAIRMLLLLSLQILSRSSDEN